MRVDKVMVEGDVDSHVMNVDTCAVIYDSDTDFGSVAVVDPPVKEPDKIDLPPSQSIYPDKLAQLSERQRHELTDMLDQFQDCFSDTLGFCDLVEHEIPITEDFKPKSLRAYKVPEHLKAEVHRQIQELLFLGFIRPSKSQMASPLVCVLKGKKERMVSDWQRIIATLISSPEAMLSPFQIFQTLSRKWVMQGRSVPLMSKQGIGRPRYVPTING